MWSLVLFQKNIQAVRQLRQGSWVSQGSHTEKIKPGVVTLESGGEGQTAVHIYL